jgi:plastocyanin
MEPDQMRFDFSAYSLALLIAVLSPAHAENITVFQEGKKFSDAEVSLKVGETVTFSNKDPITHNVYSSTPGMSFDLKTQKAGESTTITFDHSGEAEVHCAIHPQMVMKVKVQ